MAYTIKKVAHLSGVSVRTLHFYDEIGLLKPAYHAANGYRFYEEPQLLTLQQILFYRELGFPLKQIRSIHGRPDFEKRAALNGHRDIKPDNVMLRPDGYVKLLDFGIAKIASPSATADEDTTYIATEAGERLGTLSYMSPEQARGLAIDHRADIFAMGALIYEIVTGTSAFRGDTPGDRPASIPDGRSAAAVDNRARGPAAAGRDGAQGASREQGRTLHQREGTADRLEGDQKGRRPGFLYLVSEAPGGTPADSPYT